MRQWLLLAPLAALPLPSFGQDELTLEQAIDRAIRNNRIVQSVRLEVLKSEDAVAAARTHRLPVFRLNAFAFHPLTKFEFKFPAGVFGSFAGIGPVPAVDTTIQTPRRLSLFALAGVQQPLTQLRRVAIGVHLQDLGRQVAQEKLSVQEKEVANEVKKAYFGLIQTQSALDATAEALKLFRELERVATESLAQQVVLPAELLDVQTRLAQTELDELTLRNALLTQRSHLNLLIGRDLDTEFRVAPVSRAEEVELDPKLARSRALLQRSEVREARLRILLAERDREFKKAEYIPDVSVGLDYISFGNIRFVPNHSVGLGVHVSWDIFDWGRKKHELSSKSRAIEQARAIAAETEAKVLLDVDARRRALQEGRARLKVSDLARRAAQERLRVALDKRAVESAQAKEVLQMQASLAEASYKYQKDLLAFWTARADFDKALGEK
jgi:outer membrane protein TolC